MGVGKVILWRVLEMVGVVIVVGVGVVVDGGVCLVCLSGLVWSLVGGCGGCRLCVWCSSGLVWSPVVWGALSTPFGVLSSPSLGFVLIYLRRFIPGTVASCSRCVSWTVSPLAQTLSISPVPVPIASSAFPLSR